MFVAKKPLFQTHRVYVCMEQEVGLGGRKVQANYHILGCFSSNYTLVVH